MKRICKKINMNISKLAFYVQEKFRSITKASRLKSPQLIVSPALQTHLDTDPRPGGCVTMVTGSTLTGRSTGDTVHCNQRYLHTLLVLMLWCTAVTVFVTLLSPSSNKR